MSPISAPAGPAALAFENFLAVLTIIFLQQHLRLQLPRNRTERFGALRAADAITIRKFHDDRAISERSSACGGPRVRILLLPAVGPVSAPVTTILFGATVGMSSWRMSILLQ